VEIGDIAAWIRRAAPGSEAEVLARRGVDGEAYREAKAKLRAQIDEERTAGENALVVAYATAFRRGMEMTPPPRVTPPEASPEARAPDVDAFAAAPVPAAPRASPSALVPSFLASQRVEMAPAAVVAIGSSSPQDALDGTAELPGAVVVTGRVLPFTKGARSTLDVPAKPSSERPPPRAASVTSGTVEVVLDQIGAPSTPFHRHHRGATPDGELTLNQYASLCAELEVKGRPSGELLAAYRLKDEGELEQLREAWQERFEADLELCARHRELVAEYGSWLARRG
jgi:hypothetical protein